MLLRQILCWTLTVWVSVQAITIPIDRADIKSASTHSSMIANGWRPFTGYDGIRTNSGTSSNNYNERLTHPILGKYQEHMASSEKSRIQYKTNQQHEYSPPSILGSFSVFGHAATKARIKHKDHPIKQILPSETREYTFLVPPPRDVFRFDTEPHRKGILRDNDAFLRQASLISTGPQADIRNAPFFIKPTGFSSSTHSPGFSKLRPIDGFGIQQTLQLPRHSAQPFEPQKVTSNNNKVFLKPPSAEVPASFNVKHKLSENFETFQQTHTPQILNGNAGNFYSQVDHPAPYKTSYERDPAFLVHESHEVSYVTPSSTFGFNFRPSLSYDNISPSNNFDTSSTVPVASTTTPSSTLGKFLQSQAPNTIQAGIGVATATSALGSTYYVSEHQDLTSPPSAWPIQKSKFTTEINEVLPNKNSPIKFRQEPLVSYPTSQQQRQQQHQQQQQQHQQHQQQQYQQQQHQHQHQQQHQQQQLHHQQQRIPELVFLRPDLQQQYQSAGIPVTTVKQQTVEPQYETPESISLKHFNEQQYLIQQQLIQRDRQRLHEQEMQRQQKIQQQQEDELKKRQEELRILENQQKETDFKKIEAERQEHAQEQLQNQKTLEHRQRFEEQQRLIAQQQQQQRQYELSQLVTEENMHHHDNEQINEPINYQHQQKQQQQPVQLQQQQQQQLQKPESSDSNGGSEYTQTQGNNEPEVITREPELKIRTHRPVKPQRGQYRRRRPTTPIYEVQATEASPQLETTFNSLSEVPVQTTIQPDSSTISVKVRSRIRRPLNGGVRRRPRPTSPSEVDTTASANEDDYLKYDHAPQIDLAKKRRPIRPTQPTLAEEVVTERRPAIRKRPGHHVRVHPGEPFEAEVVTEIIKPTKTTYKETTEWENYPTSFEKNPVSPAEEFMTQVYTISSQEAEELSTASILPERQTEVAFPEEHYIRQDASREHLEKLQNIPLEELFDKREENQVNLPTTAASYTTMATTLPVSMTTTTPSTATITTTELQMSTTNVIPSTTRASHRIRPLRFGNATRPRFSVKDYKSRLDYKNRVGQLSTTEATSHSVMQTRQRSSTPKSQETSDSPRETTGRYKYMSRTSYRITSTAKPVRETSEYKQSISTTDRINRFTPKRKLNQNGHLYKSRITSSSSIGNGNRQDGQNEISIRYSTARPENVFSSAIRRRPGVLKNKIENTNEEIQVKKEDATEMTAEETSFYSVATTVPTLIESANEVVSKEESATTSKKIIENVESVTRNEKSPLTSSENGMEIVELPHVIRMNNDNVMSDVEGSRPGDLTSTESTSIIETTTAADLQLEEELFAKASQSVADLTSSASALYDKPGLFKAVSPVTESRVVNPNFKISTDEPTLPIEAFFQELSSKE
ncbi:putative mediator of RNA polymerase II transcription subunit 12 [Cephus cinctus]|uniref:Mediator of RNA polymerase II transcription subunit 12 n=1 Tax=Cephus cinctus TaxID=211228 RepID=A0AAJ7C8D9_CEPCN|nr:putative mediator of RNA polymerase II transcription subunit 12 [Cephus cinctus]XP_015603717.1 putative mediator of RNA polymerase II transcription subunit 12 [Cephus cinctus]